MTTQSSFSTQVPGRSPLAQAREVKADVDTSFVYMNSRKIGQQDMSVHEGRSGGPSTTENTLARICARALQPRDQAQTRNSASAASKQELTRLYKRHRGL